jgi:hypothetical protein
MTAVQDLRPENQPSNRQFGPTRRQRMELSSCAKIAIETGDRSLQNAAEAHPRPARMQGSAA